MQFALLVTLELHGMLFVVVLFTVGLHIYFIFISVLTSQTRKHYIVQQAAFGFDVCRLIRTVAMTSRQVPGHVTRLFTGEQFRRRVPRCSDTVRAGAE